MNSVEQQQGNRQFDKWLPMVKIHWNNSKPKNRSQQMVTKERQQLFETIISPAIKTQKLRRQRDVIKGGVDSKFREEKYNCRINFFGLIQTMLQPYYYPYMVDLDIS